MKLMSKFYIMKETVLNYPALFLKQVFYNTALSCDAPVCWVVNTVRKNARMSVEFVHVQVGITLYTRLIVNLIITKI